MRPILFAIMMSMPAVAAQASNGTEWAKLNLRVAESCATASKLDHAHVSETVDFDDSLGKVATVVTGIYRQRSMRGATGKMLCIYDKRTQKVWTQEAKGWSAPTLR